ncbi:MAG: putative lipid kinase [Haloplasmataceae bacterium]|jgi:diacylglycerol kinase (ATP)|nr:putative lipid kinase [Haloplasmataceae bacterium]
MKKARVIYNPTAGRELIKKNLPYVLERLEQAGYEASTHSTTGPNDAKLAARIACERKYDLIVAAGGDGTLFEVINGMAEQEYRPTLGIIPTGTTNDLARALGIPREIEAACNIICTEHLRSIDIGKAGDKYFVNIAAGGTLTELTYEVTSRLKTIFGQFAYYFKGIEKLPKIAHTKVKIKYDDKVFEDEIMLFFVCNSNSVGGFEHLSPESKLDDGYFDLIIAKKMNFFELIFLGGKALFGKHLGHVKVKYYQAKHIVIEAKNEMKLNLDGEFGGMLPTEFSNLHKHINVFALDKKSDLLKK